MRMLNENEVVINEEKNEKNGKIDGSINSK